MICPTCNYSSTNEHNFNRHKCREPTEFQCDVCNKYYKSQLSLYKHKKTCVAEDVEEDEKDKEIARLKAELEMQKNIVNNTVNNNNNTTNINNGVVINIVLPHKKTSIDHLTDLDYFNILGRNLMSIPLMIEKIHFNKDVPENHNIYIPNIKNKFAMLYNGSEWSLHNRDEIIHNLIVDNEMRLEDWLSREDIQEKFPTAFKRFESFLKLKEKTVSGRTENLNKMKEDILLMLYNKRGMIMETKELM